MAETKTKKTGAKRPSTSKAKSKSGGAASNGSASVADSVKHSAQEALNGAGSALQKAKLPLLAGGAAAAGVAGAVLATRSGGKRKVLGVSMPKKNGFKPDAQKMTKAVTDAARRADSFGQGVSRIASSVKKVGEAADEAVKKG